MAQRNQGLVSDTLFIGMTRPPMKFGVTYSALLVNAVLTTETFVFTRDLLWLLAFLPIHGVLVLLCMYEPRIFDLLFLWARTRAPAIVLGNLRFWRASSYSPLLIDLPDRRGRRRADPQRIAL
jgi:type IV secretion system protein VirB3